jgi:hypothetical protein
VKHNVDCTSSSPVSGVPGQDPTIPLQCAPLIRLGGGVQAAIAYKHLLVRYLQYAKLDSVLAVLRQAAAEATWPPPRQLLEQIREAAGKLDPAAFVAWADAVVNPKVCGCWITSCGSSLHAALLRAAPPATPCCHATNWLAGDSVALTASASSCQKAIWQGFNQRVNTGSSTSRTVDRIDALSIDSLSGHC